MKKKYCEENIRSTTAQADPKNKEQTWTDCPFAWYGHLVREEIQRRVTPCHWHVIKSSCFKRRKSWRWLESRRLKEPSQLVKEKVGSLKLFTKKRKTKDDEKLLKSCQIFTVLVKRFNFTKSTCQLCLYKFASKSKQTNLNKITFALEAWNNTFPSKLCKNQ